MSWEELTLPFEETLPFEGNQPFDETLPAVAASPIARVTGGAVDCDLSTQCGHCGGAMRPEHAHYRCTQCGQRDSCCDGPY